MESREPSPCPYLFILAANDTLLTFAVVVVVPSFAGVVMFLHNFVRFGSAAADDG